MVGWSEYDEGFGAPGVGTAIQRLSGRVVGQNVFAHERIFAELSAATRPATGGVVALALGAIAGFSRYQRNAMLDVLGQDFIRTARAKGLSPARIMWRHAVRTSLLPFVTMFGLDFGALVGGAALLTEVVFGLNGVGRLTFHALQNLDLPVILATVIYASFFVVAANALVDVLYAVIDPRVRA